ncbi:hypothetical protein BM536_036290 [Streptomyces phaeoluteigriseus]|uniref:Uncharacterized protein n=1 Tax=Streptomyces phaeoluteigriseus TaxID=114686 RepID=A0A1V6MHY5_9ACTN|nr:hypothetical protein BM536_036290 [Streptomyces phaeoluteigriseus]
MGILLADGSFETLAELVETAGPVHFPASLTERCPLPTFSIRQLKTSKRPSQEPASSARPA